jgi:hypothetical protein
VATPLATGCKASVSCGAGSFYGPEKDDGGQYKCKKCPVGTYSDDLASTACTPCPAGLTTVHTGSTGAKISCVPPPTPAPSLALTLPPTTGPTHVCLRGFYDSADPHAPGCYSCPIGKFADQPNSVRCKPCPRGMTTAGVASMNMGECQEATPAPTPPASCKMGTFENEALECEDCPAGKYNEAPQSLSCAECPEGKTTEVAGATGAGSCSKSKGCAPGRFMDAGPQGVRCLACPEGKFARRWKQMACTSCIAGQTTDKSSATSLSDCRPAVRCEPGNFRFVNMDQLTIGGGLRCEACPVGKFSAAADVSTCAVCPAGKTTEGAGAFAGTACESADVLAKARPRPAVQFTWTPTPAPTIDPLFRTGPGGKHRCPQGSFTQGQMQVFVAQGKPMRLQNRMCEPCPAGKFSDSVNSEACDDCPTTGKVARGAIAHDCSTATPTSTPTLAPSQPAPTPVAVAAAKPGKDRCRPGKFKYKFQNKCGLCPRGKYSGHSNVLMCALCPVQEWKSLPPPGGKLAVRQTTAAAGATAESACINATSAPTAAPTKDPHCLAGTYLELPNAELLSIVCRPCAVGQFSVDEDAKACVPCGDGQTTKSTGANDLRDCRFLSCEAGRFKTWTNAREWTCLVCPKGKYNPNVNYTTCDTCTNKNARAAQFSGGKSCGPAAKMKNSTAANGTAASGTAAIVGPRSKPTPSPTGGKYCPGGRFLQFDEARKDRCTACPRGKFSKDTGKGGPCRTCPWGQSAVEGMQQCTKVTSAHEAVEALVASATQRAGTEKVEAKQRLDRLAEFKRAKKENENAPASIPPAPTPLSCRAGKFFTNHRTVCRFCPMGKFNDERDSNDCVPCDFKIKLNKDDTKQLKAAHTIQCINRKQAYDNLTATPSLPGAAHFSAGADATVATAAPMPTEAPTAAPTAVTFSPTQAPKTIPPTPLATSDKPLVCVPGHRAVVRVRASFNTYIFVVSKHLPMFTSPLQCIPAALTSGSYCRWSH